MSLAVEILLMIYPAALLLLLVLAAYFIVKHLHDRNMLHRPPDLESGPPDPVQLRGSPRECTQHQQAVTLSFKAYKEQMSPLEEEGGAECVVCLSEFEAENECVALGECLHVLHRCCGEAWLRKKPSCPVCRAPVAFGFRV
uniref:RING-type domain-containing protein n=1 Tax=Kalanchoe fedtschenkoi TaxID=63787 RepID=A0A7N0RDS9_KALFE